MAEQFLHGIETIEVDDGIRPVQTVKSAIIGLIGTAPDADDVAFPLNEPIPIIGNPRFAQGLGEAGTLRDAVDRVFEQAGATLVLIRVEEGQDEWTTRGNLIGSPTSGTGVWAFLQSRAKCELTPKVIIAPGFTSYRVTDGVTDVIMDEQGTGYGDAPAITFHPAPGSETTATGSPVMGTDTLADTVDHINVADGGSGYLTAPTVTIDPPSGYPGTGKAIATAVAVLGAGDQADEVVGIVVTDPGDGYTAPPTVTLSDPPPPDPKIIPKFAAVMGTGDDLGKVIEVTITQPGEGVAPGSTITIAAPPAGEGAVTATAHLQIGIAKNPVAAEIQSILPRLRAVGLVDGPATTDTAAVQYRGDFGDMRIYVIDPKVTVYDADTNSHVAYPTSAVAAGVISRMDNSRGYWWSPSNQELYGVTGMSRPIDFNISDPNTQANYLNENEVATIIRQDGFRLWGNRTTAIDPLWAFLSVRRTCDMVYEALEQSFLWAIDRPFSVNNILEIAESVNAFLRHLVSVGALIGGKCWIDPTMNTKDQMQAGKLYVDFDLEPPAPLEHLIFRAHRNGDYYEELIDETVRRLAMGAITGTL